VDPVEKISEVGTVNGFCNLGNKLNASERCETAATPRTRLGTMKFKECREFFINTKKAFKKLYMFYFKTFRIILKPSSVKK